MKENIYCCQAIAVENTPKGWITNCKCHGNVLVSLIPPFLPPCPCGRDDCKSPIGATL